MLTASTTDMDAKFSLQRSQPPFQCTDDAGGDAGRVPVHSHHRAERLEPEWVRQPLQEFVAAVLVNDRLRDDGAEPLHAHRQPRRNSSTVQRKDRAAGAFCHSNPEILKSSLGLSGPLAEVRIP